MHLVDIDFNKKTCKYFFSLISSLIFSSIKNLTACFENAIKGKFTKPR